MIRDDIISKVALLVKKKKFVIRQTISTNIFN